MSAPAEPGCFLFGSRNGDGSSLDLGVLLLAKPYRKSELARMNRLALAS
jgi:hypothetical protein